MFGDSMSKEKDVVSMSVNDSEEIVMMKNVDGVDYTRCFYCGKLFVETYENQELHLFCSLECEKADSERNQKLIEKYWR